MKKRIVSTLLCVVLVFALGMIAFAADIAITAQPQNQSAAENETVTFSISATGDKLSYRWQYCPAGSTTWTNAGVTGCKTVGETAVATPDTLTSAGMKISSHTVDAYLEA